MMTREQQLVFCKKCQNRKLDMKQGIICGLTDEKATFQDECPDFKLDEEAAAKEQAKVEDAEPLGVNDFRSKISDAAFQKLQMEQNLIGGITAGAIASLVGAILWAVITVFTGYQIGYAAIGVGALVGFAIRVVGKGIDPIFGYFGAGLAFLGVLLGNVFSVLGIAADEFQIGYFALISELDMATLMEWMKLTFSPIDVLFYGLAIYAGYQLSHRTLTEEEVQEINTNA